MYSLKWPDIFSGAKTNLLQDKEAAMSNLKLVLSSFQKSLFGDPAFGSDLKRYLFNQNSIILKDIVIDDIYYAMITYVPQINVRRNDITITQDKTDLYADVKCSYMRNTKTDMYRIKLTEE